MKTEHLSKYFDRMAKHDLAVDTKEAQEVVKAVNQGVAVKWGIQQPPLFMASQA